MNAEAYEAWRKWCEHAVENKWQDLSQGADALAACYLDAMARLDTATELLREADVLPTFSSDHGVALRARIRAFLERKV